MDVEELSCGMYNCIYGKLPGEPVVYLACKCLPYDRRQVGQVHKIKTAKFVIHTLRKDNDNLRLKLRKAEKLLDLQETQSQVLDKQSMKRGQ